MLYPIGLVVGYISGLLGIGGGTFIGVILIFLGFDVKKVLAIMSLIIPFITFSAFLSYLSFVHLDFKLLAVVTVAGILEGYIGNNIMFFKLSQKSIKKLLALLLFFIALKMFFRLV